LYSSWDASNYLIIDDYRIPDGTLTKAEKESWITKAPLSLQFMI